MGPLHQDPHLHRRQHNRQVREAHVGRRDSADPHGQLGHRDQRRCAQGRPGHSSGSQVPPSGRRQVLQLLQQEQ
eukprot:14254837-Alexandrium_andersonii.AAC.1